MFALHVTAVDNLDSILATGLVAQIGPRSKEIQEEESGIWLFPSWACMNDAEWLFDSLDDDPAFCVLQVDMRGLSYEHDASVGFEICSRVNIPADRLVVICDDIDSPNGFEEASEIFASTVEAKCRERA